MTLRHTVSLAALAASLVLGFGMASLAHAGAQVEEQLAPSVTAGLSKAIADMPVPTGYANRPDVKRWIDDVSPRLASRVPDAGERRDLLATVHYEAIRAGLDPQLVIGVIHHESAFHKYAVSPAGARGYMQVMPFWLRLIGLPGQNLFNLRMNLRYGCTILRHYLDVENGDYFRALGRYNGSLGRSEYPSAVLMAMQKYQSPYSTPVKVSQNAAR